MSLHLYAMELSFIGYCNHLVVFWTIKLLKFHKYTQESIIKILKILLLSLGVQLCSLYVPVEEFTDQISY